MLFKENKRITLQLSIASIFSMGMSSMLWAEAPVLIQPKSAQACAALESNAARLNCYDTWYNSPSYVQEPLVTESSVVPDLAIPETESLNARTIVDKKSNSFFSNEGSGFDSNTSLLDRRWELAKDSKLGTWNIRAYQPVYLLPAFWTSNPNELPHSPNPQNTVKLKDKQSLDSTEAKFQISLKTKALDDIFGNNGDLWLGYTQSSRWQVYNGNESRPFRETNYEPEVSLIFRTNYELFSLNGHLLGVTLNHQSNGRSDPLSRSWNRAILNVGLEKDNFVLMLRPWYRIKEKDKADNNPDIEDYMGRGDLTAFYRWKEHDFSMMLRHSLRGGDRSHGAAQFVWSFPIKGKLRGNFQLFDGYGESMIDYNHRATYAGVGISLMDWY